MTDKQKEKTTDELLSAAKEVIDHAHAPYSKFRVAAAVNTEKGVFTGVNVENASYGLTVCAERNAVGYAVGQGHKAISEVAIFTPCDDLIPPCGACRQVLAEFMPSDGKITTMNKHGETKSWTLGGLLPEAFTEKTLEENT